METFPLVKYRLLKILIKLNCRKLIRHHVEFLEMKNFDEVQKKIMNKELMNLIWKQISLISKVTGIKWKKSLVRKILASYLFIGYWNDISG